MDGKNCSDATGVHPESYDATKKLLERLDYTLSDVKERKVEGISKKIHDYKKLSEELGVGEMTLQDIVKELEKPARDLERGRFQSRFCAAMCLRSKT